MMKVPGHALTANGTGQAGCADPDCLSHAGCHCGQTSPCLNSDRERRTWHRQHKNSIEQQVALLEDVYMLISVPLRGGNGKVLCPRCGRKLALNRDGILRRHRATADIFIGPYCEDTR